jgi:hypothetical protein
VSISSYEATLNQISQDAVEHNLSAAEVNARKADALKAAIESGVVAHALNTVTGTCAGPGNPLTNGAAANGSISVPA